MYVCQSKRESFSNYLLSLHLVVQEQYFGHGRHRKEWTDATTNKVTAAHTSTLAIYSNNFKHDEDLSGQSKEARFLEGDRKRMRNLCAGI